MSFEGFYRAVSSVLAFFYELTNSFGVALILLTIVVMILTAPLTLASTRSMVQMQRLQPEMKRLQTKYKDDREKLNKELMAFYQENNINPLMGCVPVLMQAPIFFILYGIIQGVTTRVGGNGSPLGHVTGQILTDRAGLTPWVRLEQPFSPLHLNSTTDLYEDLTVTNELRFFGMDLAVSPSDALRLGALTAIPFVLLMVGLFVSQWFQNRQIQGRNPGATTNPQQQMMMKVLPFMLPVFSFSFPAGLGVYYFVQGLCRIGLQHYITHSVYGPDHHEHLERIAEANKEIEAEAKADKTDKAAKKGGTSSTPAPDSGAKSKKSAKSATSGAAPRRKQSERSKAAQAKSAGAAPSRAPGRKSGSRRPNSPRGAGSS